MTGLKPCAAVGCPGAPEVTAYIWGQGTSEERTFEVCRAHMLEFNHGPTPEVTDDGRLRPRG